MPRSPELNYFLKAHYREPDVAPDYQAPACPDAERRFSQILRRGLRTDSGEILGGDDISFPGATLAKLYRTKVDIGDARKWLTPDIEDVSGCPVLVKNPERKTLDSNFGQTNALVVVEDCLFIALRSENGFKIRRPVRGKNSEGSDYDYQTELRIMFEELLNGVPDGQNIPTWVNEFDLLTI